ncbi:MAG: hypothetical protein K2X80_01170, partial [Pseudomonadaceae bacterium]|nr:hypothetical protein [Pseudomonadaceae bacterium]
MSTESPAITATIDKSAPSYVGTETCSGCHSQQHDLWQGSHHDLAMQVATNKNVLGDFNNAHFSYNGITST